MKKTIGEKIKEIRIQNKLTMDEFLEEKDELSFECSGKDSNLFISFSGRDFGNCYDIAHHKMNENDRYVAFKDLSYHSCSKCNYECFTKQCKYRNDDIYKLINVSFQYNNIIFLVPMYCSNPSSLYFVFNERMQDYFNANSEKWDEFVNKINIIAIFGSEEETPQFIPTLLNLLNGNKNKLLKIERHKYKLKLNDKVINNKQLLKEIDDFSLSSK